MNRLQSQVRDFHRTVLNQPSSPAEPMLRTPVLRARLIAEEAIETVCALLGGAEGQNVVHEMLHKVLQERARNKMEGPNLEEAIDGCIDTLVVTYGTLEAIGVDGEPFADEVMRSNMAKKNGPVDAHGKVGKPPGWTPPNIAGVLAREVAIQTAPHDAKCETCGYARYQHDPGVWVQHQKSGIRPVVSAAGFERYCRFCDEVDPGARPCTVAGDGLHSVRTRSVQP